MVTVQLSIEADLCGPFSMGTVAVVKTVQAHLGLSLDEAANAVNECVFDGQRVSLRAPSLTAARALLASFAKLPAAPRITAAIAD